MEIIRHKKTGRYAIFSSRNLESNDYAEKQLLEEWEPVAKLPKYFTGGTKRYSIRNLRMTFTSEQLKEYLLETAKHSKCSADELSKIADELK